MRQRLSTGSGSDVWHVSYEYDADDNITAISDARLGSPSILDF